MKRVAPVVTAKQLSLGLALKEFEPQIVRFDYSVDGCLGYVGKFKVSINPDGVFVACPFCGCPARMLYCHPTRCGSCCVDCCGRAEHKADNAAARRQVAPKASKNAAPGHQATARKQSKKPDEVAAKRKAVKPRKKAA